MEKSMNRAALPPSPDSERVRADPRAGYTLLEVVVSMLITAIVASSIFSMALSTKKSGTRGLRKLLAGQAARQVSETLKNYVSGDIATYASPIIAGPSQGAADAWTMTKGAVRDDCGTGSPPQTCYALAVGSHTLDNYLPAWFEGPPFNARVKYFVADMDPSATFVPRVSVTVDWTELE